MYCVPCPCCSKSLPIQRCIKASRMSSSLRQHISLTIMSQAQKSMLQHHYFSLLLTTLLSIHRLLLSNISLFIPPAATTTSAFLLLIQQCVEPLLHVKSPEPERQIFPKSNPVINTCRAKNWRRKRKQQEQISCIRCNGQINDQAGVVNIIQR